LPDVFASLNRNNVKYLIIGGIAAVLHGVPRSTFDVDILIEATLENVQGLLNALIEQNFGTATLITAEQLLTNEITIFQDRIRIDVQTSTPGITFSEAWERRQEMTYRGQEFHVVSRSDLILSKEAAGRKVDLEDVRLLKLIDEAKNTSG